MSECGWLQQGSPVSRITSVQDWSAARGAQDKYSVNAGLGQTQKAVIGR